MICRAIGFVVRRGFQAIMLTTALLVGGLLAFGIIPDPVVGSGKAATEDRAIGPVTELAISGGGTVDLVPGNVQSVRVTADDNIVGLLETSFHNGKLSLHTRSFSQIQPVTPIKYTLTLPELEKLTITGAGHLHASGLKSESLTVKMSGAGNVTLDTISCKTLNLCMSGAGNSTLGGSVEKLVVKLSGAGEIDAQELKSKSVETDISGAGTAKVWALDALKVKVSGAGTILYKGKPQIEQKITGAGSVRPIGG